MLALTEGSKATVSMPVTRLSRPKSATYQGTPAAKNVWFLSRIESICRSRKERDMTWLNSWLSVSTLAPPSEPCRATWRCTDEAPPVSFGRLSRPLRPAC